MSVVTKILVILTLNRVNSKKEHVGIVTLDPDRKSEVVDLTQ